MNKHHLILGLFSAILLGFTGCNSKGAGAPPATTPASPVAETGCTTSLIDTGQKGTVAGVARGLWSDEKTIPGTSSPSVAYTDQTATTIKYTYWNGSEFTTEVVSGDGTGAFVRLAYLSNGTPLVFWTLGVNLKVGIRSGPVGTPGSWSAGVIDTGVAPRAVEVAINPLDQVLVGFLTDTATTGRPKALFCNSPCTSASGFLTMVPNPFIEATAITAAQVATGVAWCKSSATAYYPAMTYSVTGATHYATCQNTMMNCLLNTNWTTGNVVASTTLSSKLLIDPTITGDTPKAVVLGAAGITPYMMGTTACNVAPAAFSAGTTMGTATSGNAWMTFLKDITGKFHLVANEGTTAVKYYNSTATDPTQAWNASSAMETNTLTAASNGGADIINSTHEIFASYGINAVPYDLHLTNVANYTASSASAVYDTSAPDLTGNLHLSASQLKNVAIASTTVGRPAVAYVDFSVGAVAGAKLKYAFRSGPTSTSAWESVLIPGTVNPQFPAITFDGGNLPWISYFDAGVNKFYLVTNSHTDGTGTWTAYQFPAVPAGAPIALPAANGTAMVMSNGNPVMVVIDNNAGSKGVKAAVFNTSAHSWSGVGAVSVDGGTIGASGAAFLSADSDSNGNVVVAYQDLTLTRVRYSTTSAGVTWTTPFNISQLAQGPGTTIKINQATGSPTIAYYDQTNNLVIINSCSTTPAGCATGGWSPLTVDTAAGVSGLANTNYQLLSASLAIPNTGFTYLFYPRGQSHDANLILDIVTGTNSVPTIASYGTNGNLPGAPSANFAIAGWSAASTINAVGGATTAYIGAGNWLYATSCGD